MMPHPLPPTAAMLHAHQLSLAYGGPPVLRDVSWQFGSGRLTAVLGPNGAGKSSLLRVLSGELAPSAGTVLWRDRPLAAWDTRALGRERAFLHQQTVLDFAFRVEEVVLLGRIPHLRGGERPFDLAAAARALAVVDAAHLASRLYTTLSGGERQRVQLARVIAQLMSEDEASAPRLLLLDEPTNNLDPAHQHRTLQLARDHAQAGCTVVAVIHDLNLALRYADDALLLDAGRCVASGPASSVLVPSVLSPVFAIDVRCMVADDGQPILYFKP
jgi:iron complex transport system ATP-binding protein